MCEDAPCCGCCGNEFGGYDEYEIELAYQFAGVWEDEDEE